MIQDQPVLIEHLVSKSERLVEDRSLDDWIHKFQYIYRPEFRIQ